MLRSLDPVRLVSLALLCAGALLVGCDDKPDVGFSDDIDIEWDLFSLERPSDALHLPYVRGTRVRLGLRGEDVTRDMRIRSLDSEAFREELDHPGAFRAAVEGDPVVAVVDGGGDVVRRRALPVRVPDRVELLAHGPLIARIPTRPLTGAEVVVGGTATFLVHYFAGDQRLFGNGVLSVEGPSEVFAVNRTSFLFENREWLAVTVEAPGTHRLRLLADGVPVGTFTVVGVPPERVEALALHHDRRSNSHGNLRLVWAEPVNLEGDTVFGAEPRWDLDGRAIVGLGDVFQYEVDRDAESVLGAHYGDAEAVLVVNAEWGEVTSSDDIGCAVNGAPRGEGGWLVLVVGLLASGRRRLTAAGP